MPQHPGSPHNPGGGAPPPEAMLGGMEALLAGGAPGGGPPPGPPPGATDLPSNEGGIETQVIATLAEENAQLRALVGLGPDDPIPGPEQASAAAPVAGPVGP